MTVFGVNNGFGGNNDLFAAAILIVPNNFTCRRAAGIVIEPDA
jgi:hypothetical protein